MKGKIARILKDKGFGFIASEGGAGDDIFFHRSSLKNRRFEDLNEGDGVEFEIEASDRGPRANSVTVIV